MSPQPFPAESTVFVRNPYSGRKRGRQKADQLCEQLQQRGYKVIYTEAPGQAGNLAREALNRGATAIGCFGGDGSVYETINGVTPSIPLAYFPSGTANLFARNLGIPTDVRSWIELLDAGSLQPVHLGRTISTSFVACASIGFDARVVHQVDRTLKYKFQEAAYAWTAFKEWNEWRHPQLKIVADGEPLAHPAQWIIISRGAHYAGKFKFFPSAKPTDSELHALVFFGPTLSSTLPVLYRILRGESLAKPDLVKKVIRLQAKVIEVEANSPCELELDGDASGFTPARFSVDPTPRYFLAPTTAS